MKKIFLFLIVFLLIISISNALDQSTICTSPTGGVEIDGECFNCGATDNICPDIVIGTDNYCVGPPRNTPDPDCGPTTCTLSLPEWKNLQETPISTAIAYEPVTLSVTGTNCEGKGVRFDIYMKIGTQRHPAKTLFSNFEGGKATTTPWPAVYIVEPTVVEGYFFEASDGTSPYSNIISGLLKVTKAPCIIESASWQDSQGTVISTIAENKQVSLIVIGDNFNNCDRKTAKFEIYQKLIGYEPYLMAPYTQTSNFTAEKATASWAYPSIGNAEWYSFKASVDGSSGESGHLTVTTCFNTETSYCNDGIDNDCDIGKTDGGIDYDGYSSDKIDPPQKGDKECAVGITSAEIVEPAYCPGDTITVKCGSTVSNINSVLASMTSATCTFDHWDNTKAIFSCKVSDTASGSLTATCSIDETKSYAITDKKQKTAQITKKTTCVDCTNSDYDDSTTCTEAGCKWSGDINKCDATCYTGWIDTDNNICRAPDITCADSKYDDSATCTAVGCKWSDTYECNTDCYDDWTADATNICTAPALCNLFQAEAIWKDIDGEPLSSLTVQSGPPQVKLYLINTKNCNEKIASFEICEDDALSCGDEEGINQPSPQTIEIISNLASKEWTPQFYKKDGQTKFDTTGNPEFKFKVTIEGEVIESTEKLTVTQPPTCTAGGTCTTTVGGCHGTWDSNCNNCIDIPNDDCPVTTTCSCTWESLSCAKDYTPIPPGCNSEQRRQIRRCFAPQCNAEYRCIDDASCAAQAPQCTSGCGTGDNKNKKCENNQWQDCGTKCCDLGQCKDEITGKKCYNGNWVTAACSIDDDCISDDKSCQNTDTGFRCVDLCIDASKCCFCYTRCMKEALPDYYCKPHQQLLLGACD